MTLQLNNTKHSKAKSSRYGYLRTYLEANQHCIIDMVNRETSPKRVKIHHPRELGEAEQYLHVARS